MKIRFFRRRIDAWLAGAMLVACVALAVFTANRHPNDVPAHTGPRRSAPQRITTVHLQPGFRIDNDGNRGSYTATLVNSGAEDLILNISAPQNLPPGLAADAAAPPEPSAVTVAPGRTTALTIAFRITNCSLVPTGEWPLRFVARSAGQQGDGYIELQLSGIGARAWQQSAVADFCRSRD